MHRSGWTAVALLVLAGCATATRDPAAEGAPLMHEFRLASGGAGLDAAAGFHETGAIVADGDAGTCQTQGDVHALRQQLTQAEISEFMDPEAPVVCENDGITWDLILAGDQREVQANRAVQAMQV